jgi:hypothetical protein
MENKTHIDDLKVDHYTADGTPVLRLDKAANCCQTLPDKGTKTALSFRRKQVHVPAMRAQRDLGFHL